MQSAMRVLSAGAVGLLFLAAAGCGATSWLPGTDGDGGAPATAEGTPAADLAALETDSAVIGGGEREFVDTLLQRHLDALQTRQRQLSAQLETTSTKLEELEQTRKEFQDSFEETRGRIETVQVLIQVLERDPDYLSGDRIRQIRKELSTEIPGGHGPAGDPSAITYFDDWQNPAGAGTQSAVPDALARRAAPDRDGVEDFGAPTARGETAATRAAPPPFAATPPAPTGRRPVADVPGSMRRGAPPAPSASAALPVEGKVIYLDGTGQDAVAYIDVGSDEGVTPGMYFSIGSGRHRRAVLVVTEVFGKSSKAVVAGAEHYHGDFARGDRAVRIESLPAGP